ncbi:MAG: alpha/beta fold hydrolase [Acidobacteria bacterium]|nr:alpha/beta fold hydrolase [Acidobacteriota bacterium]
MDILEGEIEALTGFDKEMRESALPIWFESLVGVDWTLLHLSPAYYGFGIPKGDGSPTVVVTGFLGSDIYLYELYLWLSRIGYTSYFSNIGWNADCLNTLANKLLETIKRANDETGKKVNLIGHSLGGVLSRSAAVQHPELIESVITLASPFRGVRSHPGILEISKRVRSRIFNKVDKTEFPHCYTGHCDCIAVTSLQTGLPKNIKQTAIYTKSDGIVDWKSCLSRRTENNYEVTGTHVGLVYNYQVYKLIGERLRSEK